MNKAGFCAHPLPGRIGMLPAKGAAAFCQADQLARKRCRGPLKKRCILLQMAGYESCCRVSKLLAAYAELTRPWHLPAA